MLECPEQLQRDILKYLQTRPYIEVVALIAQVASLQKKENKKNDGVTPKKQ
jgi:hypothetical protein|tara:strand:- start:68 stop:220 length:153 start_codon:yes stop_codon:yes gene_type:complete